MNTNYSIHTAYRPASMSAIRFHEPEKAALLDNYFGFRIPNNAVPTVNLTLGIISYKVTHCTNPGEYGYQGEYIAITKSCETSVPVHDLYISSVYYNIDNCIFGYVADLPLNVLKAYMHKPYIPTKEATLNAIKKTKEEEILKETIEKLQKENVMLRTTIEDVLKIVSSNKK